MLSITSKIEELQEAKNNVTTLLRESECLIDMHGLSYWAGVVERLREDLKGEL
jgi:hypothetical protein